MNALLVQASAPKTYWGYQYSLSIAGVRASLPPLGLISLAALLPDRWRLRLVDLNTAPLRDEDLRWADVVLVSGMLVHAASTREVLARARALGRRTVVGGPGATSAPDAFPVASHLFLGEAEGRLAALIEALEAPGAAAPRVLSPPGSERPAMAGVPVPRFDLLDLAAYGSMSVQYSRGCPFHCEFCDVIELFGRVPRVKSPDQVLRELDALAALGYRGPLFFVDDNFIGNRREAARLLPLLAAWQASHGRPFDLYTEASLDLASRPDLIAAMRAAGFSSVFLGIETASGASLEEAGKRQNLKVDATAAVDVLTRAGLEVLAGFIVGFDSDGPDVFDAQLRFISSLPVPMAMTGLLTALPGTGLWRRLEREGRLRGPADGNQFGRPNFEPALDEETLVRGYRGLLRALYSPAAYYRRCALLVERLGRPVAPAARRPGGLRTLLRAAVLVGLVSPRRWHFWRLLARAARVSSSAFARAVALAILGEHLIRYTKEDVLPLLDGALEELAAGKAARARAAPPAPARVGFQGGGAFQVADGRAEQRAFR